MYIASSSTSVKFHSFPDGDLVYNYQPGSKVHGPIRNISWSKDGIWMSVVPKSGCPELISVRNQLKLIHTVIDVEEPSCTAFQNTTRKFIAFGTRTGQTLIYDVKQKKIKTRFPRSATMVTHIEFTARDSHLVTGCLNGEVHIYSNLTYALSCTLRIPRSDSCSALRTNPVKRNFVVGGSNEGVVVVWDTNVNKHKFFVECHKAPVTGVAFSPNNPDLIISTGSDRQFFCHDIVSQKCIASVPVNNSMMAVDFSHDGTHFALASHEGNISVYDSRRIMEPILVFEAHNNTIQDVAFQKQEMVNSNSSLLEDLPVSERHSRHDEDVGQQNVSFGNLLPKSPEAGEMPECENACGPATIVDSFLDGLGLNRESMNKYDNSYHGEGDNWAEFDPYNRQLSQNINEDTKRMSLYKRRSLSIKQASTSTPTCPLVVISKMEANMSPIVKQEDGNNNQKELNVPLENMEKLVEDIMEKKLSEKFEAFSQQIKYQFSSTNAHMRRMHLDVMMEIMKGFIKEEERMRGLREDLASNSPLSENYLLEENIRLKKQIALLEEQLTKADLDK